MNYKIISKILILVLTFSFFSFNYAFADTIAPSAPRGFDAVGGPSGYELVLTWTNPQDEDLDHIEIYFGTSGGYYASLFKTVSTTPDSKGQMTITDLSSSANYFLFLKSVDKSGNKSLPTTEIKRMVSATADTSSPDAVSALGASDTKTGGTISLSWTNPANDDFFQSRVYRSNQSEFTPSAENQIAVIFGLPSSQDTYTDTGLINNQIYYYKIRTEDNRGNLQTGLFYPSISIIPTLVEVVQLPPEEQSQVEKPPSIPVSDIVDGGLIRAIGAQDIYIIKIVRTKKFKRLILNPEIFNSYGHLKWENVKEVEQSVVDGFVLSDLIIEVNADGSIADLKVYRVSSVAGSDIGEKRWLNMTAAQFESVGYDWDAIYRVNHTEASLDFYPTGSPITP